VFATFSVSVPYQDLQSWCCVGLIGRV